jgi:hypothetical protein
MTLPNADRALVEPAKVRDYLLSHEHPVGRSKAAAFEAVGYHRDTWETLQADLVAIARVGNAVPTELGLHGQKYEVAGILTGPVRRELPITTIWLVRRGEDYPRLVTAYPRARR